MITGDQDETAAETRTEGSENVTVCMEEQDAEPMEVDPARSATEEKNAEKTAFEVSQNAFDRFVTGDRNPEVNGHEN